MEQICILFLVCLANVMAVKILPSTPDQFVTVAKCTFIVYGEFTYDQAVQACGTRQAMLGFFTSKSEEHTIRSSIDFRTAPGTLSSNGKWVGQLWIGAKKTLQQNCWNFDNPIFPNQPLPFTVFSATANVAGKPNAKCAVMREDGWAPMDCSAVENGAKQGVGALCTQLTRTPSNDSVVAQSRNYCGTFLLPPSTSTLSLPLVIKKKYFFVQGNFSFSDADRMCASQRGQLVTARSKEEFNFLTKNLDFSMVNNRAWFGLKRSAANSDDYVWVDGLPNTFTEPILQNDGRQQQQQHQQPGQPGQQDSYQQPSWSIGGQVMSSWNAWSTAPDVNNNNWNGWMTTDTNPRWPPAQQTNQPWSQWSVAGQVISSWTAWSGGQGSQAGQGGQGGQGNQWGQGGQVVQGGQGGQGNQGNQGGQVSQGGQSGRATFNPQQPAMTTQRNRIPVTPDDYPDQGDQGMVTDQGMSDYSDNGGNNNNPPGNSNLNQYSTSSNNRVSTTSSAGNAGNNNRGTTFRTPSNMMTRGTTNTYSNNSDQFMTTFEMTPDENGGVTMLNGNNDYDMGSNPTQSQAADTNKQNDNGDLFSSPEVVRRYVYKTRSKRATQLRDDCVSFVRLGDGNYRWLPTVCYEEMSAMCELFEFL